MSKVLKRRKSGTRKWSTEPSRGSDWSFKTFDLELILEDLEADLCELLENVTEHPADWRADSGLQTVDTGADEL